MSTYRLVATGLLCGFLFPVAVLAAELRAGDQVSLNTEQIVEDDVYMAGGTVSLSGEVRGDALLAGGTILVNGLVQSDVFATGGNVSITSSVGDDVRVAGGNVVLQGDVAGDVIGFGGQVMLSGERIGGDVVLAGGAVSIDTPIGGDVRIMAGDVRINAPIAGQVFAEADQITLGPRAQIGGNFTYTAPEAARFEEGAVVLGTQEHTERESLTKAAQSGMAAFASFWFFARFFMTLVGALILAYFFRTGIERMVSLAGKQPLQEMGRGLVVFIVLPIASLILFATVLGIPLGVVGLLLYALLLVLTSLVAPIVTGALSFAKATSRTDYIIDWKIILLGTALYVLVGYIPFIGWALKLALMLVSLGALAWILWDSSREWR